LNVGPARHACTAHTIAPDDRTGDGPASGTLFAIETDGPVSGAVFAIETVPDTRRYTQADALPFGTALLALGLVRALGHGYQKLGE
jgi:hypothetical protein